MHSVPALLSSMQYNIYLDDHIIEPQTPAPTQAPSSLAPSRPTTQAPTQAPTPSRAPIVANTETLTDFLRGQQRATCEERGASLCTAVWVVRAGGAQCMVMKGRVHARASRPCLSALCVTYWPMPACLPALQVRRLQQNGGSHGTSRMLALHLTACQPPPLPPLPPPPSCLQPAVQAWRSSALPELHTCVYQCSVICPALANCGSLFCLCHPHLPLHAVRACMQVDGVVGTDSGRERLPAAHQWPHRPGRHPGLAQESVWLLSAVTPAGGGRGRRLVGPVASVAQWAHTECMHGLHAAEMPACLSEHERPAILPFRLCHLCH